MSFLFPKSSSLPSFPSSPSRGGQALDEARRAGRLAARLRSGRAPTILTDSRLAGREPASAAGRPVTIAGALQDEALRGMGDVAFLHRGQQIRPEAQREIDEAKRNPGKALISGWKKADAGPSSTTGRPGSISRTAQKMMAVSHHILATKIM